MYVCVHICLSLPACMYICVCMNECLYVCIFFLCMTVCMYLCLYTLKGCCHTSKQNVEAMILHGSMISKV